MDYGYLTMLDKKTTTKLIETIKPDFIFSGDIHHDCYFLRPTNIHDYVVNTFSFTQGNVYPGSVILTIQTAQNNDVTVHVCRHHNQILVYISYIILFVISVSVLFGHQYIQGTGCRVSVGLLVSMCGVPFLWYLCLHYLAA